MAYHNHLTGLLARVSRLYKAELNALLTREGFDLSSEMCGMLVLLWEEDEKSQQELADILKKDKGGITRIIKSLEARRLIQSVKDEKDRRVNRIFLTEAGQNLQALLEPVIQNLREKTLNNITQNVQDTTLSVLEQMIQNLEEKHPD